jgi:hypothetical protein
MKYLILLSFCVFILSCEKEPNYYPIPQILKDCGLYKKGSYWIYQNDSTMITDSIYISFVRIYNDSIYSDKKLRDIYETIIIDFYSSQNKFSYSSKLEGAIFSNLYFEVNNTITKDRNSCILLRINLNNEIVDTSSYYYILEKKTKISLNNISYSNVLLINTSTRYYYSNNSTNETFYNQYWLSKGNWIIKKVIHTYGGIESWTLIRKNIIL